MHKNQLCRIFGYVSDQTRITLFFHVRCHFFLKNGFVALHRIYRCIWHLNRNGNGKIAEKSLSGERILQPHILSALSKTGCANLNSMATKRKGKHKQQYNVQRLLLLLLLLLFVYQLNTSVKAHEAVEYHSKAAVEAEKKLAAKNEQKKTGELRCVCVFVCVYRNRNWNNDSMQATGVCVCCRMRARCRRGMRV